MSDIQMVDISGLDKAAVLATLFNASAPSGMGFLQARFGPSIMTVEDAQQVINAGGTDELGYNRGKLRFGWLFGRPLEVDLSGDAFDPSIFDRDNGGTAGTAKRFIDHLRASGQVNSRELNDHRNKLLVERIAQTREFVSTPTACESNTSFLHGSEVADLLIYHLDKQVQRFKREW